MIKWCENDGMLMISLDDKADIAIEVYQGMFRAMVAEIDGRTVRRSTHATLELAKRWCEVVLLTIPDKTAPQ